MACVYRCDGCNAEAPASKKTRYNLTPNGWDVGKLLGGVELYACQESCRSGAFASLGSSCAAAVTWTTINRSSDCELCQYLGWEQCAIHGRKGVKDE